MNMSRVVVVLMKPRTVGEMSSIFLSLNNKSGLLPQGGAARPLKGLKEQSLFLGVCAHR